MDRVSEIRFLRPEIKCEKWVERKLNMAFLQSLPTFLMIFQSEAHFTIKNHQKYLAKNEEKPCPTFVQLISYSRPLPKPDSSLIPAYFQCCVIFEKQLGIRTQKKTF